MTKRTEIEFRLLLLLLLLKFNVDVLEEEENAEKWWNLGERLLNSLHCTPAAIISYSFCLSSLYGYNRI